MSSLNSLNRRDFLAAGVAAGSAAMLASAAAAAEARPEGDIRVGMIGTGGRGSGVLKAIANVKGVQVTALCDLDEGRLNAAAKSVEAHKPKLFKDYHRLIEHKDLDAVFVETPCNLHAEMVLAVLQQGLHCYGEKPMAITVKDVNAVFETSKKAKGIYQVGTQLPYAGPFKSTLKALRDGIVGKIVFVRAHRHNVGDLPHDRMWLFKQSECGDTILEQAVHEFDLFNDIMQGIPVKACGFGGQSLKFEPKGRDIRDHYAVVFDYGDQRQVEYSHSWIAAPKVPCDGRRELVYGEKGQVDVEEAMLYLHGAEKREQLPIEPKGDSTQLAVDDFFRCIREGTQPLCNAERGRNAALVGLIGRKALDTGKVVTMKELLAEG